MVGADVWLRCRRVPAGPARWPSTPTPAGPDGLRPGARGRGTATPTFIDVEDAAPCPPRRSRTLHRRQPHRRPRLRRDGPPAARPTSTTPRASTHSPSGSGGRRPRGRRRLGRRARAARRPTASCSPTWPAGRSSSASAPGRRTGAPTTPTRTSCASSSAATSSSGGSPTGTSARSSTGSTSCSTPTRSWPTPSSITGDAFRDGLRQARRQPFRVVPFFDPGVVGRPVDEGGLRPRPDARRTTRGASTACRRRTACCWLRRRRSSSCPRSTWCSATRASCSASKTFARFGAEFPIRFDFLDTMGGGNLSLQVHPLTDYIQSTSACPTRRTRATTCSTPADDAVVYLGLQDGHRPGEMVAALWTAPTAGEPAFAAERVRQHVPGAQARPLPDPGRAPCTAPARTRWCWRSARRRTSSPSSCGTGAASGSTACRGRSTRPRAREHPVGPRHRLGRATNLIDQVEPSGTRATAGARSAPACTSSSSSRRGGTGSPARAARHATAPSTC